MSTLSDTPSLSSPSPNASPSISPPTTPTSCLGKRSSLSPPQEPLKKPSLMSLVVESISTEDDRKAGVRKPKDVIEEPIHPKKNTEQDWDGLKQEIKEMIGTTMNLNKLMRPGASEEQLKYAIEKTAEIFVKREKMFQTIVKCSPSYEKRDTLALLYKLREIDDKDPIGVTMRLMDVETKLKMSPEPRKPVINIGEFLGLDFGMEPKTTLSKQDAENILMAFKMSFYHMVTGNPANDTTSSTETVKTPT